MKNAQHSMEFLMTYGWMLVALLIVLALLSYFGLGNKDQFIPDECVFLSGLNCLDVVHVETGNASYPSAIDFVLRNEFGFDIVNISLTIIGTCNSTMSIGGELAPTALTSKDQGTFHFLCQDISGRYIEETIKFDFVNMETNVLHTKRGSIRINQ